VEQLLTYKRLKSPEPWYPRRRLVSLYYDQKLNLWQGCTTYWKRWATKKSETKVECHKDDFQHEDRGAEWRENWGAEWWIEPSGVRSGEGCPLPSRLVGLGERHELPQWGPEPQPETHCGRIFWLIEHVWQTALSQNLHFFGMMRRAADDMCTRDLWAVSIFLRMFLMVEHHLVDYTLSWNCDDVMCCAVVEFGSTECDVLGWRLKCKDDIRHCTAVSVDAHSCDDGWS